MAMLTAVYRDPVVKMQSAVSMRLVIILVYAAVAIQVLIAIRISMNVVQRTDHVNMERVSIRMVHFIATVKMDIQVRMITQIGKLYSFFLIA